MSRLKVGSGKALYWSLLLNNNNPLFSVVGLRILENGSDARVSEDNQYRVIE